MSPQERVRKQAFLTCTSGVSLGFDQPQTSPDFGVVVEANHVEGTAKISGQHLLEKVYASGCRQRIGTDGYRARGVDGVTGRRFVLVVSSRRTDEGKRWGRTFLKLYPRNLRTSRFFIVRKKKKLILNDGHGGAYRQKGSFAGLL